MHTIVLHISGSGGGPGVVLDHATPVFLRHLLRTRIPRVTSNLITVHHVTHLPKRHTGVTMRDFSRHVSPIKTYMNIGNDHIRNVIHRLYGRGLSIVGCDSGAGLFVRHTLTPTGVASIGVSRRGGGTRIFLGPRRIDLTVNHNNVGVGLTSVLARCAVSMFHRMSRGRTSRSVCLSRFSSRVSR